VASGPRVARATASYNYDPYGRLDAVTSAGQVIERNVYDGFDHITENRKTNGGTTATTRCTYDPLDRTSTKTTDAGTAKEKTTNFTYLGLSTEVLDEDVAGAVTKSYQYSPWGERLSQVTHNDDGTTEDGYYGYNPHTDVEQVTDEGGDTNATYGYTAYGSNDDAQFTGIDKPDAADPTKEQYNAYRFNAKRFDQASGTYDMGFRDYSPGLNRFLTRDSYNGALNDLNLGLDPFTGNRYAFAGGNPITRIENDGHDWGIFGDIIGGIAAGAGTAVSAASGVIFGNEDRDLPPIAEQLSHSDTVLDASEQAGVDPTTVMALLLKEGNLRAGGGDTARTEERLQVLLTRLGLYPGTASIGMGQMQEQTFMDTAANHPDVFAGRSWEEMIDDDELAITALAYHVKDLQAELDKVQNNSGLRSDELIAIGYNQGADSMVDIAVTGELNPDAENYLYGRDVRPGYNSFRGVAEDSFALRFFPYKRLFQWPII
jgi:RHS repeat-associated protein